MLKNNLIFLLIIPVLLIPAYAQETQVEDSPNLIPAWIKGTIGLWVDGFLNDIELINALEFMIETGIIPTNSTSNVSTVSVDENRILKSEASIKDIQISNLEKEKKDFGLDNAKLLVSITDMKTENESAYSELNKVRVELKQHKEDYPAKYGKIGGQLISIDLIKQLNNQIDGLEAEIIELKEELKNK